MAERMNLGKLTIHTACAYIDRIVMVWHLSHNSNEDAATSPVASNNGITCNSDSKGGIKVITPRNRILGQH
jgi:hypothetical protein